MVDYRTSDVVAILEVNNPPVNALSHHVRVGFAEGIQKACSDDKVQAIVIIGKGRTFPSGADIKEFGQPIQDPWLTTIGHQIEESTKPVVCAIHGTALGGGLEVCLFSHYRIADKNSRVGFPEVNIGILPGAEGTVRLPRLTGLAIAMDLISSGRHVSAQDALKYGILDKVVEGDLLKEAIAFATSVVGKPMEHRRLSNTFVKDADSVDKIYDSALTEVKKKYKGLIAPISCLKAVKASAKLSFTEASHNERALFAELMLGGQSVALRYAFFAERSAPKWNIPGGANSSNTKPSIVKSVGVIGAGTMGSGIAVCVIRVGIPVQLVERDEKVLNSAMRTISGILMDSVKRKRMTVEQSGKCLGLLRGSTKLETLSDVDLVIEAVYEDMALKKDIFSRLDKICRPSTILCSNTSTLDIDAIAASTQRPDKVIGAHFFSPAYIMRLLENIYGAKTSPSTVATVMQFGKTIGKIPVLVRTCDGFVANRMNRKSGSEALFLLEEGALPQDVDRVLEDFGMTMGTFKVSDLAGIDVGWRILQEMAKAKNLKLTLQTRYIAGERYTSLSSRLYELGRYGRKNGKGWYRYENPMASQTFPDPDVTDLILAHCQSLGIKRRVIGPQEIVDRYMFAAINEGFKILQEGVAEKPEDIDVIWLYGFSFPRYRGGPMFYASQIGLKKVYERVCHFHETMPYSSYWMPSDLLKKLASHSTEVPMNHWTRYTSSRL